jgi:hypothetical protein
LLPTLPLALGFALGSALAELEGRVGPGAGGWRSAPAAAWLLPAGEPALAAVDQLLAAQGFELLSVELRHGLRAGGYLQAHRDPFDRLLAAQAELESLTLVSIDAALRDFPCRLLW